MNDVGLDYELSVLAACARSALAQSRPMATLSRLIDLSDSLEAGGSLEMAIAALTFTAPLLLLQGRLRDAWRTSHQAAQLGTDANDMPLADVGAAYISQAEVLREWGRIGEAFDRAEEGRRLLDRSPYTVLQDQAWLVRARIHRARGELLAAEALLDALGEHPLLADNPYQRAWMLAGERVRTWLAGGDLLRAEGWAESLLRAPRHPSPFARAQEDLALARVALAGARPGEALAIIRGPLADARAAERRGDEVDALLLAALAHQQLSDEPAALAAVGRAVLLAEPEGYVRRFVEEGAPLQQLLANLQRRGRADNCADYLARLLDAFEG